MSSQLEVVENSKGERNWQVTKYMYSYTASRRPFDLSRKVRKKKGLSRTCDFSQIEGALLAECSQVISQKAEEYYQEQGTMFK